MTMVPMRPGSWEAPMKATDWGRKRESRWRRLMCLPVLAGVLGEENAKALRGCLKTNLLIF